MVGLGKIFIPLFEEHFKDIRNSFGFFYKFQQI